MLFGEYEHTIDPKKRLSLPSKFRTSLGKKVVVTRGLDTCLFVYTTKEWSNIVAQFAKLSLGSEDARAFNRFMLAGAVDVEIDSAGRILIPEYLCTYAGLSQSVTVTGVGTRAEIWDTTRWRSYSATIAKSATATASALAAHGSL